VLIFLSSLPVLAQQEVMNHLIAAREYLKAGNEQLARLEIDSALMISPADATANAMMGDLLYKQEKYLNALLSYDKAILVNTKDASLYIKRAQIHTLLNNHELYIIRDYNDAIRLDPTNIKYYEEKAAYLSTTIIPRNNTPDYSQAAETITQALAISPDNPHLLYLRSKYNFDNHQNLAALADINRAIVLKPTDDNYLAQRGYINFMIENYVASYYDYSRAIKINQTEPLYYEFRGHANYNRSKYVEAYDDYSQAIDLIIEQLANKKERITSDDPLNKQLRGILLYRGMSLVQENKPYDGCEDFDRAYKMGESKARNYMRKYCY
jgi:tetratricopeptide (TPR) repeat protein